MVKKPDLMKWTTICMDKCKVGGRGGWGRGLSIRNLSLLNQALSRQWSWGFASKGEVCLETSYRGQVWKGGSWHSCKVRHGYEIGVWKPIRRGRDLFQ